VIADHIFPDASIPLVLISPHPSVICIRAVKASLQTPYKLSQRQITSKLDLEQASSGASCQLASRQAGNANYQVCS